MKVPEKFVEIARLSDEGRAKHKSSTARTFSEIVPEVMAEIQAEYRSGIPRPLTAAIQALSDSDFKELTGWTTFGMNYSPLSGEPFSVLENNISTAVIDPRDGNEAWLEQKPIGEYLRAAVKHLETTPEQIARAQAEERGEYDEDEDYSREE